MSTYVMMMGYAEFESGHNMKDVDCMRMELCGWCSVDRRVQGYEYKDTLSKLVLDLGRFGYGLDYPF